MALPEHEITNAASTLLPFAELDPNQLTYLTYRLTGFTRREAAKLAGVHESTISRWRRHDPTLVEYEQMAQGAQGVRVRQEIAHLLFIRNYVLFLRRDFDVMKKIHAYESATDKERATLPCPTLEDRRYAERARAHYSPQQLAALEQLMQEDAAQNWDFSQFIITLQRQTMRIETK